MGAVLAEPLERDPLGPGVPVQDRVPEVDVARRRPLERLEAVLPPESPAGLGVRLLEKVGLFRYGGASVGFYDRYLFPMSRELDRVLHHVIGKNLIAVARKPG